MTALEEYEKLASGKGPDADPDDIFDYADAAIAGLQAERDVVLREAIRYFYGNHNICDDDPCDACEHWVRDFPRMVAAQIKEAGKQ